MTDHAESPAHLPIAPPPSSLRRLARNLVVDAALPWLAVQLLEHRWGVATLPALAVAALIPVAAVVLSWTRYRRTDFIGLAVLVSILTGVIAALVTNDPHFAVVKAAPAFGLFGIACLASLRRPRPLMFFVARQYGADGDDTRTAAWAARLEQPGFRRVMQRLTLVWGVACLIESMLGIAAAFLLAPELAIVVEPVIAIGTTAALLIWTTADTRRQQEP